MKICVCGSRVIKRYSVVEQALTKFFAEHPELEMTELISGAARGVDTLAENWAIQRGIPVQRFPADWDKWGMSAGFRRNVEMVNIADVIIAIMPEGMDSKGTSHTIRYSKECAKPCFILRVIP